MSKKVFRTLPLLVIIVSIGTTSFFLVSSYLPKGDFGPLFPETSLPTVYSPKPFETQVAVLINNERQNMGLTPLTMIAELAITSQTHNNVMNTCSLQFGIDNCLSHQITQLNEPDFVQRIKNTGYYFSTAGEIIGRGYATPTAVVNGWMNSPPHKAIILTASYTDIGCGFLDGNGGNISFYFWTCDFANISNGQRTVVNASSTPSPTPASTPRISPTPTPGITPTPIPMATPTPSCLLDLQGDTDCNNKVDIFDFNRVVSDFGKTGNLPGDINNSGKVDIFDFNLVVTNFGKT